jgi:hypothetical protein
MYYFKNLNVFHFSGNIYSVGWYVSWEEYHPFSVSLCTLMEVHMYTNGLIWDRFITQQESYESSWSE